MCTAHGTYLGKSDWEKVKNLQFLTLVKMGQKACPACVSMVKIMETMMRVRAQHV